MRKSPTFSKNIICEICGKEEVRTGATQRFCKYCSKQAEIKRKKEFQLRKYPNRVAKTPYGTKKCEVCGDNADGSIGGVWYCNKHWLRMYKNGTLQPKQRKRTNTYRIDDDICYVGLPQKNITFIVNKCVLDKVQKYSWCISKTGYLVANISNKTTKLHRYLLNYPDGVIDHINGNPLDNRLENLRICSQKENGKNLKKKSSELGLTGISITPNQRYCVRITYNRKNIHVGTYDTIREAKQARIQAEKKYFGEFSPYISRSEQPRVEIEIEEVV